MITDQQIIIEVAKLDGFEEHPKHHYYFRNGDINGERVLDSFKFPEFAPNYLTSRDAIIPVIEKVVNTKEDVWNFSVNLSKILTDTDEDYQELSPVDYLLSTPKQLSTALLKATGKWTEE